MKSNDNPVGVYGGEPIYLDGYVPSSWDSHHSSLLQGWTWLGMGLILSSLGILGAAIYGFTTYGLWGSPQTQDNGDVIGWVSLVLGLVMLVGGGLSIHVGRARYRRYKEATGRIH
ncbi:MAG: hypothetical protein ACTH1D_13635 [Mycobacteriaceae bacterium]|uniref:hypothetical protein n=1 Tax=Corynebacterium sp. TaxID=1720 RepID=UPI003F985A35